MPRVIHVLKARKDVKNSDIKKGESYYWWKFKFGGKHVSRTMPKQSQLTQSDFLQQIYAIGERIEDMTTDDDFESEIDSLKSDLESLRDETQDKHDNMPDQLQDAPTGEMLQNRCDEIDSMIDELDGVELEIDEEEIAEDIKNNNEQEEGESKEDYETRLEELTEEEITSKKDDILGNIQSITYNGE